MKAFADVARQEADMALKQLRWWFARKSESLNWDKLRWRLVKKLVGDVPYIQNVLLENVTANDLRMVASTIHIFRDPSGITGVARRRPADCPDVGLWLESPERAP